MPPLPLPDRFSAEPPGATHRAVVAAQLLLAAEAHVEPVARHVQVLRAEAGAAAEAPRGPRRRHGEEASAAAPGSVRALPARPPPGTAGAGVEREARVRSKFPGAEENEDSAPENGPAMEKGAPGSEGGRAASADRACGLPVPPSASAPTRRELIAPLYR